MDLNTTFLVLANFFDSGYKTIFDKDTYTVINVSDKSTIFIGQRKDNVYKINFSDLVDQKAICLLQWMMESSAGTRVGHANCRLISKPNKMKLVKELPEQQYHSDAFCGACQRGKIVKTFLKPKNIVSTSIPLELLHIDLFRPVKIASINGK